MVHTDSRRVELFVRSLSPGERNPGTTHLPRLRRLADEGHVDLSVSVWGREVGLSTTASRTDTGQYALDRVAAFREWADGRDVRVDPFFETREVNASQTGESYAALVLPTACLAEYRDGDLDHVAPYATDSAVHTVADRVSALEDDHHGSTPEARTPQIAAHR